jgi:hypothetical protein
LAAVAIQKNQKKLSCRKPAGLSGIPESGARSRISADSAFRDDNKGCGGFWIASGFALAMTKNGQDLYAWYDTKIRLNASLPADVIPCAEN